MAKTNSDRPAVGRPRRFDDETERRMLIEAAIAVMGRHQDASMPLDEVLAEAGLSTRAFYRHFDSKESLLEQLILREAAAFGRSLERAVTRAADPIAAVEAWLKRFLDAFFEPRRAARTTLLTAAAYSASGPSAQMMREMKLIACAPLIRVLREGNAAGVLTSPTPELDAYSIHDLVAASADTDSILGLGPRAVLSKSAREATYSHVIRFAWPALGLPH